MSKLIQFNESQIAIQENNMVSLTDLWKSSSKDESNSPNRWLRLPNTTQFVETVAKSLNGIKSPVIKTTRGKGGGTWAHWQIALAYAKYLSPELHMFVNQVFKERLEEEANPELAYNRGRERAVNGWKRQGKTDDWISNRLKGMDQRKVFTSTLSRHGVEGRGYADCTNNIHEPIIGKPTHIAKQEFGVKKKGDSIRNYLGNIENIGIMLAEALANESIDSKNLRGNEQCSKACHDASSKISKAIKETRAIVNG